MKKIINGKRVKTWKQGPKKGCNCVECAQTRFICHNIKCGKELIKETMKICGQCYHDTYCSKECQVDAWKTIHKSTCINYDSMTPIDFIKSV